MALLTGLTDQGVEVPVQVTPAGVLVAEGLQGPPGADGNNGAAEIGAGFVILQGAGTARVMGCWGHVVSDENDYARVVFPRPFLSPPSFAVADAEKATFSSPYTYCWMLKAVPDLDGADIQCIRVPGGGVANLIVGGRTGLWTAWGPVA